jgi:hypothetical protein
LRWNFTHRIVSSISRSSSKMRIIRQGFTELHQEISLFFSSLLCKYWPIPIFANQNFRHTRNGTSTIIYHSIENFMGYKTMLNSRGKYAALKISSILQYPEPMKNSRILTLCLYDMCLFPIEPMSFFRSKIELVKSCKIRANHSGKCAVFKISSIPQYPKTMKNSYILTLCLYDMCLFPIEPMSFFRSR